MYWEVTSGKGELKVVHRGSEQINFFNLLPAKKRLHKITESREQGFPYRFALQN